MMMLIMSSSSATSYHQKHHQVILLILGVSFFINQIDAVVRVLSGSNDTYSDRLSAFGPVIISSTIGYLIAAGSLSNHGSEDGCHPVAPPDILDMLPDFGGWIALVQRGECSFLEKVRAMQTSGAKGVVVGDNVDSDELITMYASEDTSDIIIPSVFVSKSSFRELRFLSQYAEIPISTSFNEKDFPHIHDTSTKISETHNIQKLDKHRRVLNLLIQLEKNDSQVPVIDLILVSVLSPLSIFFCLWGGWQFIVRRRRRMNNQAVQQASPPYPHIANEEYIQSLPIKKYSSKEADPDEDVCAICLDDYMDDDDVRILLCNHEFHKRCIDPWLLTRSSTCPTCKSHVGPAPPTETVETEATETTPLLLNDSNSRANVSNNALTNDIVATTVIIDIPTDDSSTNVTTNSDTPDFVPVSSPTSPS